MAQNGDQPRNLRGAGIDERQDRPVALGRLEATKVEFLTWTPALAQRRLPQEMGCPAGKTMSASALGGRVGRVAAPWRNVEVRLAVDCRRFTRATS